MPVPGTTTPLAVPGSGVRATTRAASPNAPPPVLGEHTGAVLDELGLGAAEIESLFADGVVAGPR